MSRMYIFYKKVMIWNLMKILTANKNGYYQIKLQKIVTWHWFLSFILTLTDVLPKNLIHTLTLINRNLTDVIKMSQFQPKGKL